MNSKKRKRDDDNDRAEGRPAAEVAAPAVGATATVPVDSATAAPYDVVQAVGRLRGAVMDPRLRLPAPVATLRATATTAKPWSAKRKSTTRRGDAVHVDPTGLQQLGVDMRIYDRMLQHVPGVMRARRMVACAADPNPPSLVLTPATHTTKKRDVEGAPKQSQDFEARAGSGMMRAAVPGVGRAADYALAVRNAEPETDDPPDADGYPYGRMHLVTTERYTLYWRRIDAPAAAAGDAHRHRPATAAAAKRSAAAAAAASADAAANAPDAGGERKKAGANTDQHRAAGECESVRITITRQYKAQRTSTSSLSDPPKYLSVRMMRSDDGPCGELYVKAAEPADPKDDHDNAYEDEDGVARRRRRRARGLLDDDEDGYDDDWETRERRAARKMPVVWYSRSAWENMRAFLRAPPEAQNPDILEALSGIDDASDMPEPERAGIIRVWYATVWSVSADAGLLALPIPALHALVQAYLPGRDPPHQAGDQDQPHDDDCDDPGDR